jgi:hypothetical protein
MEGVAFKLQYPGGGAWRYCLHLVGSPEDKLLLWYGFSLVPAGIVHAAGGVILIVLSSSAVKPAAGRHSDRLIIQNIRRMEVLVIIFYLPQDCWAVDGPRGRPTAASWQWLHQLESVLAWWRCWWGKLSQLNRQSRPLLRRWILNYVLFFVFFFGLFLCLSASDSAFFNVIQFFFYCFKLCVFFSHQLLSLFHIIVP